LLAARWDRLLNGLKEHTMAADLLRWTGRTVRCHTLSAVLVGLAGLWLQPAWAGDDDQRHGRASCLIVDTDVASDDLRAFAVLFPNRSLRAVVVTEGISSVSRGSTAIALFLASGQSSAPVIPGLAADAPPAYGWLPAARAGAERINGLLVASVPSSANPDTLKLSLFAALRGCHRVDVLVLGPWSSFVQYAPMLRPLMRSVVASGRPLTENNPDNFNCVYDQAACGKADEFLRTIRSAVWVDLPADGTSYLLTQEMVDRLAGADMPGMLRAALNADPSQWLGTRLWDDTAALYLLNRKLFKATGAHFEPAMDEQTLRGEWVKAINATPAH
jgi:inosine-uridine nucleoside N-ribohydrolase